MDQIWNLIIGVLIASVPLIATALGGMFSEKSGIVNIGLEGIMTFSAFLTAIGILLVESLGIVGVIPLMVGLVFGIIGGILFAGLHALLTIKYKVDQIISGTAINIIGLSLAMFLTKLIYNQGSTSFKQSFSLRIFDIPLLVIFIIALVFISAFIVNKTKWGLRLRACGEDPYAAQSVGINVNKIRYQAVLLSGVFGAIGGASLVILVSGGFSDSTVAGRGFIALAVLIFGQWNPYGILGAGILFGFLTKFGITITTLSRPDTNLPIALLLIILVFSIAIIYKSKNKVVNILLILVIYVLGLNMIYHQMTVPSTYYDILPYIMTIIALVYYSKEKVEPSALGKKFEKE